ncbi:exopolysaccharide biosynthesis polyprenyl glycosylphosphotransferase [Mangrovimonas aestuarii]|uniref:exopolysaccharide biosynthesis polyprenyl glycosylphosphotransferase n=1 Tax=Mangrovimonas aestuarii TaxID=3018443 RepID=UPI002379AD29|nr:exopolysaccharide biosynthesis polyprenyl glycosylphosphotransferase [Mangrovimonas aestuarii]
MTKRNWHFNISERKILLRLFDITFVLCLLHLIGSYFHFNYFSISTDNWVWIFVLMLYITIFGTVFEMYDLKKSSELYRVFINIVLTATLTVGFYLMTPFWTPFLPEKRLHILYFYLAIISGLFLWRLGYIYLVSTPRFYKRVLFVGDLQNTGQLILALEKADPNYHIIGSVCSQTMTKKPLNGSSFEGYQNLPITEVVHLENVSEVIITNSGIDDLHPHVYNDLMSLMDHGIPIKEYNKVYEDMTYRLPVHTMGNEFYKHLPFSRSNYNALYQFFQRLTDIIVSCLGLLVMVILLPFIFAINLVANRGPLFYIQDRVGRFGKTFKIIKFRTMIPEAEPNGPQWTTKNDKRVTPFGKLMRGLRMDEIPQFINVMKGEMSLIGPRPERPEFVKELSQSIPFYDTRHVIPPGLTGWSQVNVRFGSSVEASMLKLQYDLYYIKHRDFFLDINIMVKTLTTVLFFRGQ